MKSAYITIGIVALSVLTGAGLSAVDDSVSLPSLDENQSQEGHDHGSHAHEDSSPTNYTLGSDHGHALFYVNLNGSEYDFSREKFQLRSSYVHLENSKPHIVHKHAENVTWSFFLETMNIKLDRSNKTCITIEQNKSCGKASVVLNGDRPDTLDRKIRQGDNFAIVLPKSNETIQDYMDNDLPEDYKPDDGRSIALEIDIMDYSVENPV
ncbi:MAG: hypothetical protein J07AB43_06500 [Candidatus Nanosalina sp. J07AB43]|nr:MAG: hypothetical protein J07AB43_06500 [Candidatus Nanosalina sp. J07AB43]